MGYLLAQNLVALISNNYFPSFSQFTFRQNLSFNLVPFWCTKNRKQISAKSSYLGGCTPGQVVMGGGSSSVDCEFEYQHRMLDGRFSYLFVAKLLCLLENIRNKRKEAGDGRLKKHEFITHFSWNGLCFEVKWSDWLTILFKGFYWTGSKAKRFTWLVRSKPVIVLHVRGMGQSRPLFLFLTVLKRLKKWSM